MEELVEKTKEFFYYQTWVGSDPLTNSCDTHRMAAVTHPDFLLTYNGDAIICGIEQLGLHFRDAFKEIGHWHHDIQKIELLGNGNRYCVAYYNVVTERKGSTPVKTICVFQDGLCIAMHEKVDFTKNKIDIDPWIHVK